MDFIGAFGISCLALDTANRNTRKDTSLVGRLKLRKAERRKTDLHNKKYRIISRIIVIIFIILATFFSKNNDNWVFKHQKAFTQRQT